tara:strand:- start:31 stop:537 length:507 start_codon:yes stop_codon:yes gene_type:complete
MNFFLISVVIFVILYLVLNWFSKTSSKKISNLIRKFIIFASIGLALLMIFAGRFIFSLPFLLMILPIIKTKAGLSLVQLFRIWGLLKVLKNSGRFNFNAFQQPNSKSMPLDEAYKILNLDPNKKYTKDDVQKSYKIIMKRIHPDVSPELTTLASIVNQAKDTVLKNLS